MKEQVVVEEVEVEGVEVIDFGDATVETKQPHAIIQTLDSCCTFTRFGGAAE